jgi:CubicO group peptidase (beta-lactamase class C family)
VHELPAPGRRFDALLAQAQRSGRLPSITAGLVRASSTGSGEAAGPAWVGRAGDVAGERSGEPADTQYRIGSITKTFTSVLVLQARDEGLLGLDEPLASYLPDAPYGDRPLRAMLSHSAGIPGEPVGPWWERSPGGDFAALAEANRDQPARYDVDADHVYSNLAFGLLGEVVARVRGEDWWSLVRSRILDPLGMRRTTYQATPPHAQGYSVSHLLGTLTPEPHSDTGAMAPAGQMWSTVTDLATYADFVLHGHTDVLALSTLQEAAIERHPGSQYGLGFRTVPGARGALVGHTGTMPGFMAVLLCERATGTAFVGFTNATVGLLSVPLATSMLDALAESDPEVGEPWWPTTDVPDEVRELVGVWHWGETAFEVSWDSGELRMLELRAQAAYEEYHREDRGWVGTDGTLLEVVRGSDGAVSHLLSETYLFTRTPYDPSAPIPGGPPEHA